MPEPLVSSVQVRSVGGHESVSVWLRGKLVGALIVGEGEGELLRTQLLATYSLTTLLAERDALKATIERVRVVIERPLRSKSWLRHEVRDALGPAPKTFAAPGSADSWKAAAMESDELGSEYAERCAMLEATLADVAKGSTHELVRHLLEKLIAAEKSASNAEVIAASWKRPCERAEATLEKVRSWCAEWYHCMSPEAREQLSTALGESVTVLHMRPEKHLAQVIAEQTQTLPPGVEVRLATDEEQREALDRAARGD